MMDTLFDPVLELQVERWVGHLTRSGSVVTITTPPEWDSVATDVMIYSSGPYLFDKPLNPALVAEHSDAGLSKWAGWDLPAWMLLAGYQR